MLSVIAIVGILVLLPLLLSIRVWILLPSLPIKSRTRPRDTKCSVAVFLGSGGHTSEMKALVSTLHFERYYPRTYIYCHGDDMSLKAVAEIESIKGDLTSPESYNLLALPRARHVGQPLFSTLFSVGNTLLFAVYHLFLLPLIKHPKTPFADLLIVNGPGTCVVLVVVSWIRRIIGLNYTRVIYAESFARVNSLSLSGKLIRPFADRFLVQWPDASDQKAEYKGWLV